MSDGSLGFLSTVEPLPFEDLFVPLVLDAREELRRQADASSYGLLTFEAHTGWERFLLRRFTFTGAKAAHWQFQVFKTVRTTFSEQPLGEQHSKDALYRQFIGDQPAKRLQTLFSEFPALEKLCVVLIKNWLASIVEFLTRLEADRAKLDLRFSGGTFVCPVTKIAAGLGDPHRGGRCVVKLTFEVGTSLIYKPRSVAPEAHFSVLLAEFVPESIPHSLRSAQCWDRRGYGWMEDVATAPCSSVAGIHAFYWRAGAMLGLIYLARGVDCHCENLIAAGEFPVLVDLEALWHPRRRNESRTATATDSVLRTGFLPRSGPQQGKGYEWGALSRNLHSEHAVTTWLKVNEDEMAWEKRQRDVRNLYHLPTFAQELHLATTHVPDILAGFEWIGQCFLGNVARRSELGQWLSDLTACPRRLILRPSVRYQELLERLTVPKSLREERLRAKQIMTPAPSAISEQEEEARALEQMDIPYFEQDAQEVNDSASPAHWPCSIEEYLKQLSVIAESLRSNDQSENGYP